MAVLIDIDMPINCSECDRRYIRQLIDCQLIFRGCANCGRHPKCPLKSADEMIKEISICKTENEMRIAERDYKSRLWISGIFSEVVGIIHKYCDKEQNNERNI